MTNTEFVFTDLVYDDDENTLKTELQKGNVLTFSFRSSKEQSSKLHICANAIVCFETKPYLTRMQTKRKLGRVIPLPKKK